MLIRCRDNSFLYGAVIKSINKIDFRRVNYRSFRKVHDTLMRERLIEISSDNKVTINDN